MSQLNLRNPPIKPCGILMIPLHWQSILFSPSFKFCWRQLIPPSFPLVNHVTPSPPVEKYIDFSLPQFDHYFFFRLKLMNLILFESVVLSLEMLNLTSLDFSREKLHIHSCTWYGIGANGSFSNKCGFFRYCKLVEGFGEFCLLTLARLVDTQLDLVHDFL